MSVSTALVPDAPDASDAPAAAPPVVQRRLAVAPTRRLAVLLALVAPLWLLSGHAWGRALAVGALACVALAALIDALLLPPRRALTVRRTAAPGVGLGEAAPLVLGAACAWPGARVRRPLRARLVDQLPAGVRRTGPAEIVLALPVAGTATADDQLVGVRRGVHALGPLALVVEGPLGLVARTARWTTRDTITVAPSVAGVRRMRLLTTQHRLREAGVRQQRRRGDGGTVAALREYVPGDDPRHLDWKASARRAAPVVREYAAERGQTVLLVVDAGRLMTQPVARVVAGPPSDAAGATDLADPADAAAVHPDARPHAVPRARFDAALDAALVLADVAARGGDRVGLLVFDDAVRVWVPPIAGGGVVRRLREALVGLHPRMVEPDYAGAFRTVAERHRRRSLVVLFSDVIDARASRALLAHVARGRGRHLPLVVALRDEALDAAAHPAARPTPLAVYESAAAEELLLARADALARMRQAGVSVLDVPASAPTVPLVNRYLELKARAAI